MDRNIDRGGLIAGIILIIVGIALLLINLGLFGPELIIAIIGASFLAAYAFRRLLGFLIPGMILTWLGIGIALIESDFLRLENEGSIILIALGLAFVSIYIFMSSRRHWWPLIPGGILLGLGIVILLTSEEIIPLTIEQLFGLILPTILILIGIWLIIRQYFRR